MIGSEIMVTFLELTALVSLYVRMARLYMYWQCLI